MARSLLVLLGFTSAACSVTAYVPQASSFAGSRLSRSAASSPSARRGSNALVMENFGLDFAEDQAENTPAIILGEANYKQWVGTVNDNSMLNRQYNVLRRVRDLELLKKTVDAGVLTKLEANGVDLETIEELLPALEQLGALSFVANNQQLVINLFAPLLVEGAPFLLPLVAGALGVGPPAFYAAAAACAGTEYLLLANDVEVPFIGLSAGLVLGLLLVPLTIVSGGVGVALASAKK